MKRYLILFILLWAVPAFAQFGGSPFSAGSHVLTGDLTLEKGEIIDNSTDGIICLQGAGGTNNEDICFDLETLANIPSIISNTGVTRLSIGLGQGLLFNDGKSIEFGTGGPEVKILWDDGTNDSFQIGTDVGGATKSGYISIMENGDMGLANREPSGTSADPVLRVYSSDATAATDYIEMYHNQTDANIDVGTGGLKINVPNIAVGGTAVDANYMFIGSRNSNDPTASKYGGSFSRNLIMTSTNNQNITGLIGTVNVHTGAYNATGDYTGVVGQTTNQTSANADDAWGVVGSVYNQSTGTIVRGYGVEGRLRNLDASGTITTGYILYGDVDFNNGTIGTTYGLYLGDLTDGTQTNTPWGIYVSDAVANNHIAGSLMIGDTDLTAGPFQVSPPAEEIIAAAATITADACGTIKQISTNDAGAVTTNTTNTFTAPAAANEGCCMDIINTGGADNITLDNNANFKSIGGADIVMTPDDSTRVCSNGSVWYSVGSLVAN